jgi:flagellar motor switch protein FliG
MSKKQSHDAKRTGTERAAIFLLSLGEQEATEVMKHMGAKDVQRIGAAMTQLQNVSRNDVSQVLSDFTLSVEGHTSLGVGVDEYLRKVLVGALGEDKARGVIDRILFGRSSKGLEALKWMDPRAVAELIRRVATLDGIQPTALHELDEVIEKQFAGRSGGLKTSVLGGVKSAANILNFMDSSAEAKVVELISKADEALGSKIQDLMFVFDDISQIDDRGVQEVLRAVPSDKLLLAIKGADEPLKQKIFKNMSQRAADMMKDDLEAKGPVRLSEVEAAQKEILAIVRKMAEAGTIQLGGKGEEFV